MPPIAFNIEKASITREAARKFPPGTDAAAFQEWFSDKAAGRLRPTLVDEVKPSENPLCEMKILSFTRVEGCMNILDAHYCVDPNGKLMSLAFEDGGYC